MSAIQLTKRVPEEGGGERRGGLSHRERVISAEKSMDAIMCSESVSYAKNLTASAMSRLSCSAPPPFLSLFIPPLPLTVDWAVLWREI